MPYNPGMSRLGTRSLGLLAVAAAMATATPAAAQVYKRTASDGTTYFTNIQPNPTVQRVAYAVPARESQRPASSDYGLYSREIAEASARYGVPAGYRPTRLGRVPLTRRCMARTRRVT